MKKIFFSATKGFTLIELLIVIAIIGILSSLVMSNFVAVQQRGRDARRKGDLKQIQAALELYRSDNGGYPCTLTDWQISDGSGEGGKWIDPSPSSSTYPQNCSTVPFTGKYMQQVPKDPINKGGRPYASSTGYEYGYWSSNYGSCTSLGQNYILMAVLENKNDQDSVQFTHQTPCGLDYSGIQGVYILTNP